MSIVTIEDIKALDKLKNQIFVDYNSIIDEQNKVELFNSFKSVKECKKILESIYSRMCENFNINNNAKINMNFCDLFETINNFDIDKNTIELGYYKDDEININLIVNCTALNLENYNVTQINNNSINKYSKNWAVTLLDIFLHESYQ